MCIYARRTTFDMETLDSSFNSDGPAGAAALIPEDPQHHKVKHGKQEKLMVVEEKAPPEETLDMACSIAEAFKYWKEKIEPLEKVKPS